MIEKVFNNFLINIESAIKITDLYDSVINIAKTSISGAISNTSNIKDNSLKEKLQFLENIQDSPVLKEPLNLVREQQIVLMVSAFENFLKDLTRELGNDYRSQIKWPEDKKQGKLDIELLKGDETTIGDLILKIIEQSGINFQDLQSIERFFKEYIGTALVVEDVYKNNYILATAIRHIVIHNDGKINHEFKKHIRNINLTEDYNINEHIAVTGNFVNEFRDTIIILAEKAASSVKDLLNGQ